MINREQLIRKFNPVLHEADFRSPLTVGNGDFAFTADITGLQTLAEEYKKGCPLLTMSSVLWHTTPFKGTGVSEDDPGSDSGSSGITSDETVSSSKRSAGSRKAGKNSACAITYTEYRHAGRSVRYPIERFKGEEAAYDSLRMNPHRFNLMRLGFVLDGKKIRPEEITDVRQELDLYTGILSSAFKIRGKEVTVETFAGEGMTLAVSIESVLLKDRLSVKMEFPYASPDRDGGDFDNIVGHSTLIPETILVKGMEQLKIKRIQDADEYFARLTANARTARSGAHELLISSRENTASMWLCISFAQRQECLPSQRLKDVREDTLKRFYMFWNRGAMINVLESPDPRAFELERRIILSMYQTYIQCTGELPPQETGLTCNSWYGKFHLEMHPLHTAYLALYGRGDLLERSLGYYKRILGKAKALADSNGFKGARWPKMTDPAGDNSPSVIAPLLLWQQPHIIFMTELLRIARYSEHRVEVSEESERDFLERYANLITETADFMADYAEYDASLGRYRLLPPMYTVQEKGDPEKIIDPPFENAYWSFGLRTAYDLMKRISREKEEWIEIAGNMAETGLEDGLIPAWSGYKNTYSELNLDHPAQLFAEALFGTAQDPASVLATLEAVKEKWDFDSLWGWDFAMLAMVYARLKRYDEAFEMLLMCTGKNNYAANGNNAQADRYDLPLYLPGNGSLLLAMSAMKSTKNWYIETEGIMNYPF